ncbi:MAG: hypothetical protein ACI9KE_003369 [Polyangiales bacterium]|jgi:hypothetical protein
MKSSVVFLSLLMVSACGGGPGLAPVAPAVDVTVALAPVSGRGVVVGENEREEHTGILDASDTIGDSGSFEDMYEFYATEGQMLRITMDSEDFDTMLRLRGPNGEIVAQNADRPGGGVNSQIETRASTAGRYSALANSYQNGQGGSYVIVIEIVHAEPMAAATAEQSFTLYPGFSPDPKLLMGNAGGTVNANQISPDCRGWIGTAANHTMTLSAALPYLGVMINSAVDTTLVIQKPDGTYLCDDDGGGSYHPFVGGAFEAGTYQIFAGTYSGGGQSPQYRMAITTEPTLRPEGI